MLKVIGNHLKIIEQNGVDEMYVLKDYLYWSVEDRLQGWNQSLSRPEKD